MAVRKTSARRPRNSGKRTSGKNNRVSLSMVFWVGFFIVLITAFFVLLPKVRKGISLTQQQTVTEQSESSAPEQNAQPEKNRDDARPPEEAKPPVKPPPEKPVEKSPAAAAKDTPQEKAPEKPAPSPPRQNQQNQPVTQEPARQSPSQPERKPPETRDRTIYFIQEGNGGADLQLVKVTRKLEVSDSPLLDSLNALLSGPSAEERNRGLSSFVPPNSRILSARVNNNTVFLNFNEEFRYNTLGREGSAAQLRQIVWTATEFPNVNNVQIMIEGNIVDFLVEGITIRNPIGR